MSLPIIPNRGGVYIDSTSAAVTKTSDNGYSYGLFIPETDGTFGDCNSNIVGLTGSIFTKGTPVYFIAERITIATGKGTLYNI